MSIRRIDEGAVLIDTTHIWSIKRAQRKIAKTKKRKDKAIIRRINSEIKSSIRKGLAVGEITTYILPEESEILKNFLLKLENKGYIISFKTQESCCPDISFYCSIHWGVPTDR